MQHQALQPVNVDLALLNTEKVVAYFAVTNLSSYMRVEGYVLSASGRFVEHELEQVGRLLEEWPIEETPELRGSGVMVWEGYCVNDPPHSPDCEPRLAGQWRVPTDMEVFALMPDFQ